MVESCARMGECRVLGLPEMIGEEGAPERGMVMGEMMMRPWLGRPSWVVCLVVDGVGEEGDGWISSAYWVGYLAMLWGGAHHGFCGRVGCREVGVVREAKDSVRQGSLAWRWGQQPEVRVAVEGSHD